MVRKAIVSRHKHEEIAPARHSTAVSDANLRRLDRLANLGTLSAGIAHEIKNGLVPIRTFMQLMLEKSDDRELAVSVERELKRIDSMVSQMLQFAALKPVTLAPVRVQDVLEIILRLLQHQIDEKIISVTRDYQAVSTNISRDEGGAAWLEIQVRDTGVGIREENLERIFEPFFTTKRNGTGLGLAISHRVILEHHGRINARSEFGKGATFIISLPTPR
jgi:signal transduction histidine kinase